MKKALVVVLLLVALGIYVYVTRIVPARAVDPTLRGSGTIEATEVVVSPKVAARLLTLTAEEGSDVKEGDTLATLDCADVAARREQVEAQIEQARAAEAQAQAGVGQARASLSPLATQRDQAKRDAARLRSLASSSSAPESQAEKAESAYQTLADQLTVASRSVNVAQRSQTVAAAQRKVAAAALRAVEVAETECTLKTPVSGRVARRHYEVGELLLPGANLLAIDDLRRVYTWVYLPNEEIGRVHVGQRVNVKADTYGERVFVGDVAVVNPKAEFTPKSIQTKEDRTRLVYGVKVMLDNPDGALLPGMPVEAAWDGPAAK